MKTVVFSDTHLNGKFEEKRFRFLESLVANADSVIINGDFWEGFVISFDQFIASPWRHLFPILKKKNAVYIYGNHDSETRCDSRVSHFSAQQKKRHVLTINKTLYLFEHGDRLLPFGIEKKGVTAKLTYATVLSEKLERLITRQKNKQVTAFLLKRYNEKIKQRLRKELKPGEVFVCGHTHFAEHDVSNCFINLGIVRHGLAQYLVIDGSTVTQREEWYD
ncbi:metallophosphoesterase family protein [Candidatus Roizmanbacteria bacterium]|nr:metallophosphoesterase family protein [Candidatus Roizmanbacteria bacterium]